MTFKRIMLIVLPLLGAVFVFMVLRWLHQDWDASFVATPAPPPDGASPVIPMGKEAMRIQNVAHEVSTNVNLVRKGSDGRIDMRFLAERVDHQQSDTADIQRPRIQFFTRTGEVLTLLADQARVATTGTITNLSNIESGLLWGNVILIHDRRTPDDATDDLYVDVDNLKFDGEMSELATDGPVILVGPDIMLTARKMRMAIDRTTRRVTTMTFLEDIRITLATGEQMSIGLTGPAQMPPAPGRGSAGPAPEKTAPPAAPVPALSRIGPPKAPSPAVAAEGLAPPAAQAESADLWRIDLAGNVDASQGDQRLRCDRLGLYNRPGRAAGQTAPVETPGLPRRRPDEPDAAARGPGATARAPGAAAPESSGGSATDAPRRREGAALARLLAPDAPPPLIVVADGPLVITPVSLEERARLGDLVYQVAATGSPAVIEDAQTHAEAAEVQYNLRTGSGSLVGKGSPVVLEQPKRLRLTGGRLDFDRVKAIAVVQGEGQLEAQVQAASLTGTGRTRRPARQGDAVASPAAGATPASAAPPAGPPAPAAPTAPAQGALSATAPPAEGPSMLQASWTRGMGLEFYPPAAGASSAAARRAAAPGPADGRPFTDVQDMMGEIRRATFHGHAVVKQQGGMLKGEELAIDFLRAEAGRGQAVERLVGRGDVFIKNEPPPEPPAAPAGPPPAAPAAAPGVPPSAPAGQDTTKAPSTPAIGDIACQDLDLQFSRDAATGETQPKRLRATGGVAINDPSGEIRAEELTVNFGPSTKGGVEPQFFEAFGKVFVNRDDLHAEGDHMRRDLAAGTLLLEGRPARAARGQSRVVGQRVEFSQADGTASVRGTGELEVLATTDLRGRQRTQPEPLLVKWKNSMLFEDKRNFAQFDGAVTAATGASRLSSERLWVYFGDRPAGQPASAKAASAGGAQAAASAASAPSAAKPRDEMDQLFGRKALVRILAENDVRALEQQLNPDKTLRYAMETLGDNLTYVEENRKAYIRGPGRLRLLARERAKPGEAETHALPLDAVAAAWKGAVPDGYARTDVAWSDSMAYDGLTDRAYFKGDVDAAYAGRTSPAAETGARRRPTATRLQSSDLQIVFSERAAAGPAGQAAPTSTATLTSTAASAAKPPAAAGSVAPLAAPATPREERMAVEKLVADGGVLLWIDDRRGSAERLIYQREPELMRLYRGTDDWARLWQESEATQEFGEIVARIITYEPSTGRVDVVDQQSITISPRPRPAAPGVPAPRPLFQP